jgi:hypothetical protein
MAECIDGIHISCGSRVEFTDDMCITRICTTRICVTRIACGSIRRLRAGLVRLLQDTGSDSTGPTLSSDCGRRDDG